MNRRKRYLISFAVTLLFMVLGFTILYYYPERWPVFLVSLGLVAIASAIVFPIEYKDRCLRHGAPPLFMLLGASLLMGGALHMLGVSRPFSLIALMPGVIALGYGLVLLPKYCPAREVYRVEHKIFDPLVTAIYTALSLIAIAIITMFRSYGYEIAIPLIGIAICIFGVEIARRSADLRRKRARTPIFVMGIVGFSIIAIDLLITGSPEAGPTLLRLVGVSMILIGMGVRLYRFYMEKL